VSGAIGAIGNVLSSLTKTVVSFAHHDFTMGSMCYTERITTATHPFKGLGNGLAALGAAANIAGMIKDGQAVEKAAVDVGMAASSGVINEQLPPLTQDEFDSRFTFDSRQRFEPEIKLHCSGESNELTEKPDQKKLIEIVNNFLSEPESVLMEIDPITKEPISSHRYRVVEYEIYAFKTNLGTSSLSEIPGSHQTIVLDDISLRSPDDPLFVKPTLNPKETVRSRWLVFNFYDVDNGYRRSGYSILLKFQLITNF
jgi:hypothetical protein